MYVPFLQRPLSRMFLAVRTSAQPDALAEAVYRAILDVDPLQPASSSITMRQRVDQSIAPQKSTLTLITLFAALAVTLAIVGLYGVIAFAVSRRLREMGIRIALGAQPRDIHRIVLGQAASVIGVGLGIGVAIAVVLAGALRSLLFGVRPADPISIAAVTLLLAAVGFAACWLPARRATRADPVQVLRYE